jgi:hypothetical protein
MSDWYVANLAAVAHEAFEEETVLINFERGTYFSLRQSAPAIWAMLQTPVTPAAILDALAAACGPLPAEAPAAVTAMLDRLCEEGCLLRSEAGAAAAAPAAPGGAFALPVIEAFHDLSELIAIDPVHDTHEFTGWPHRPPAYALEE